MRFLKGKPDMPVQQGTTCNTNPPLWHEQTQSFRFFMAPKLRDSRRAWPLTYNTKRPMTNQKKTRREMLEEFVAKKPDDAFSRYGLAMECMNAGDSAAADIHFRYLIASNSNYVPAYLMYGQFLARESRTGEAKRVLTSGIAAASKSGNEHARSEMETLLNDLG